MQNIEGPFFMDAVCPKCGQHCGNGGYGMALWCQCGWTSGLDPRDDRALAEIFRQHYGKNALAGAGQNRA